MLIRKKGNVKACHLCGLLEESEILFEVLDVKRVEFFLGHSKFTKGSKISGEYIYYLGTVLHKFGFQYLSIVFLISILAKLKGLLVFSWKRHM